MVDGGKLAGMISIGDIVEFRNEAIEREAEDMKSYIASAGQGEFCLNASWHSEFCLTFRNSPAVSCPPWRTRHPCR